MNMFVTQRDAFAKSDAVDTAIDPEILSARQDVAAASSALGQVIELDLQQARRDTSSPGASASPQPAPAAGAAVGEQTAFEFGFGVRMDMATTPQGLELSMELPGVQDRDIEIEVLGETLTVRGEVRRIGERSSRTYRMSERAFGPFTRSIDLPKGVRSEQIKASLERGLLSIFVPNPVSPAATRIHIQSALTYLTSADGNLEFAIAAPGVSEDDLEIEIEGGVLTILGRPRLPQPAHGALSVGEMDDLTIYRAIELPANAPIDQIVATLSKGVLKVTIPNRTAPGPQRIQVRAG